MSLISGIVEFLFSPKANCPGCGSALGCENDWLCPDCYAKLEPLYLTEQARVYLCSACGEVLSGSYCSSCGRTENRPLVSCAAYAYREPIIGMVRAFKFGGVYRMDGWMGQEMLKAMKHARIQDFTLVVPVPMHPIRKILRGFNPAERLARVVAFETGTPTVNALKRLRNTRQQAKLPAEKRRTNLQNAFAAVRAFEGERVLLVDDVRTTGTTVRECANTLFKAGASSVCVVTFASAIYSKMEALGE